MTNYELPVPLSRWDKYGKTISITLFGILFLASLVGYLYLTFISDTQYINDKVIDDISYDVIAIYPENVRPGQTGNDLILKVVPNPALELPLTISIVEQDPSTVIIHDERLKKIETLDDLQLQTKFDVVNSYSLPDSISFQINVTQADDSKKSGSIKVNINKLSTKQLTLITTLATGLVTLWLFFGQEILKKRISK